MQKTPQLWVAFCFFYQKRSFLMKNAKSAPTDTSSTASGPPSPTGKANSAFRILHSATLET